MSIHKRFRWITVAAGLGLCFLRLCRRRGRGAEMSTGFEPRCEIYEVAGAENVRDIGGYQGSGDLLRKRRFIRAGGLHNLKEEGVAAIRALGVDCIIDLRSTFEEKRGPDTLRNDSRIDYVHIPMLDYIQSAMGGQEPIFPSSMAEMYRGLLDSSGDSFRQVLEIMAKPDYDTIIFHCTAGKDRTGITAMLLLSLAGVERADIVEDYTYSDKLCSQKVVHKALPAYLFESRAETIEAALDHLQANYGGPLGYLHKIGLGESQQAALRGKLLTK